MTPALSRGIVTPSGLRGLPSPYVRLRHVDELMSSRSRRSPQGRRLRTRLFGRAQAEVCSSSVGAPLLQQIYSGPRTFHVKPWKLQFEFSLNNSTEMDNIVGILTGEIIFEGFGNRSYRIYREPSGRKSPRKRSACPMSYPKNQRFEVVEKPTHRGGSWGLWR